MPQLLRFSKKSSSSSKLGLPMEIWSQAWCPTHQDPVLYLSHPDLIIHNRLQSQQSSFAKSNSPEGDQYGFGMQFQMQSKTFYQHQQNPPNAPSSIQTKQTTMKDIHSTSSSSSNIINSIENILLDSLTCMVSMANIRVPSINSCNLNTMIK
jgi:hypothetical protein